MVLLKDNHIDYAGGVKQAIYFANKYLKENNLNLKIEVEVRSEKELKEAIAVGQIDRIMLDNFSPNLSAISFAVGDMVIMVALFSSICSGNALIIQGTNAKPP